MTFRYYRSEDDKYICRALGFSHYEAWMMDTSISPTFPVSSAIHWVYDDRIKTWADEAKRRHPLRYIVGGYSAEKMGQKKGSFTLTLLHCNVKKYVKRWTGNTVIESRDIVFRRKIQATHIPRWLKVSL